MTSAGANNAIGDVAGVSLGTRVGMIVGALSTGTMAESLGMSGAFVVMAFAHLLAWLSLGARASVTSAQILDHKPALENLRESAQELKRNHVLLVLVLVTAVVEIFGTSFSTLVAELAEARLSLGAEGIGWLFAAQAVGAFLAGSILFTAPPRKRQVLTYTGVIPCLGLMIIVLGFAQGLWMMLLVLGLIAAAIDAEWALFGNGALVVVTIALAISPSLRRL